ncbi:NADP-dependent oxidoreductase [Virgibacillus siamensis]|uniref:NADP-dependent oxidoreductase n=1 Tax=Virgibacillus siamensis TaxID=480071 RepID=UPI0009842F35|nr:NADP-dependent oxidoreductase [Virgibacillus siamensis]
MTKELQNQQIILAKRPSGMPAAEHFSFQDAPIANPEDGQVLIQTLYISVDPYMRGRMNDEKSYVTPFKLNEPINGRIVGKVLQSESDQLQVGDNVVGMLDWKKYNVTSASNVRKIEETGAPLPAYLSVLGINGLTAYFGLLDIGQPQKEETVVVSGAAGAVGMIVGQIAKLKGTRVVGIAGTDAKTDFLKNELGFDDTINYKTTDDISKAIAASCPNGVDVYFDNVGGPISDGVMNHLNDFARIPLCGAISSYNRTDGDLGTRIQPKLIKSRSMIKGFIVGDYSDRFGEGMRDLSTWLAEGKLNYRENIIEGFENVPDAFLGLFKGDNLGKQLVKVAEE